MKVVILKPFYFARNKANYRAGDVVDVRKEDAEVWLKSGMALQDKLLPGPSETKEAVPSKPKTGLQSNPGKNCRYNGKPCAMPTDSACSSCQVWQAKESEALAKAAQKE